MLNHSLLIRLAVSTNNTTLADSTSIDFDRVHRNVPIALAFTIARLSTLDVLGLPNSAASLVIPVTSARNASVPRLTNLFIKPNFAICVIVGTMFFMSTFNLSK